MAVDWQSRADPFASGNPDDAPGRPTSSIYRGIFQTALAGATIYAGTKFFGPGIANYGRNVAHRLAGQAGVLRTQLFGSGALHAAEAVGVPEWSGMLHDRQYGRAAKQTFRFLTAPVRHMFGARGLDISTDLTDTSRLLYGFKGVRPQEALSGWRHAAVTPGTGSIRQLLLGDVMNLPRKSPIFDRVPYQKDSFGGSLRLMRAQLLRIQKLEGAGKLPTGTLSAFTNVPVDRAVFRSRGGAIHDLRSLDPEHWGLKIWDRFAFPKINAKLPSWMPIVGGEELPISGAKPLSWIANLYAPIELLRKQPISRGVRLIGEKGIESPYLYSRGSVGGRLRPLNLRAGPDGVKVNITTPIPSPRAMRRRYPGESLTFDVGAVEERGIRLASASSPLGKGVRIRKGYYHHDLDEWMKTQGIADDSWGATLLRAGDKVGIGPHLTSPQIFEEVGPGGRITKVARNKVGALEGVVRSIFDTANRAEMPHLNKAPLALGEANVPRFISYKAADNIRKGLGHGTLGAMAQGVADYANYSLVRPLYLLEEALGLGLRPGKHLGESLWRIGTRIVVPAYFMAQGLRYFDFESSKAFGISPSDFAFNTYAGAQVARAKALEVTGLQGLSRTTEELFPGSVSSPLSGILRTVFGGAVGAVLAGAGRRRLMKASSLFGHEIFAALMPIMGAGTGAFLAGSDPRTSSKQLQRQYSGEELVPIRRSRNWELGRDSYYGRDIMYYRPHLLAMHRNRTWEKSLYGSEENYWKYGTFFPNPRNLFGWRKAANPYYLEDRHAQDRPYPQTGTFGGEVPGIGPLIEGDPLSAARMAKPAYISPNLDNAMAQMGEHWAGERGVPSDVGERLGLPAIDGPYKEGVVSRFSPGQVVGKAWNATRDWLGMQGFLWNATLEKFTGTKTPFGSHRQLETSDHMDATERWLYDLELGGGFQTFPVPGSGFLATEFLRRFVPHRDRSIELVNPMPNNMPSWLPGPRSEFDKDKNFYLQGGFHLGDPYCVSADTLIDTEAGLIRADAIQSGAVIKTHLGNWRPVERVAKRALRVEERCFKVTVTGLRAFPFVVSEEHPIYTLRSWGVGREPTKEWCAAQTLKPGDRILYPLPVSTPQVVMVDTTVRVVDTALSYLIGIYAAEGSTQRGAVRFSLHDNEQDIRDRIDAASRSWFQKGGKWYHHKDSNGGDHIICSTKLQRLISDWVPGGAPTKRLPFWALALPREETLSLVKGLVDGDGGFFESGPRSRIHFKTVSKDLAYQLWQLLLKLGYRSRVTKWKPPEGSIAKLTAYQVNVNGPRARRLAYELGYTTSAEGLGKTTYEHFRDGYAVFEIQLIEEVSEEFVYGFEVGVDDSFCVAGVATHNTKLPHGDVRLPGPGYESIRPLHSGIPSVYDPVDRLLILEDVAPYSEATKHYRTIVEAWSRAGVLDDSWKQQVLESSVRKERRATSKSFGVKNLFAEPGVVPVNATISKVTSPTTFQTEEYPYTFRVAGIETSTKKLYTQQLESANSQTYSEAEQKVREARLNTKEKLQALVGQQVQLQISADQASRYVGGKVMALVPGINPGSTLRSTDQEGLAAYTRGTAATRAAANLYYGAASVEPIDPITGWLKNKLMPVRSPVEDYYKFQVLSNRFGMWETPYESYVKPWMRNIPGSATDYIPAETEQRRKTFRDFETLKYLKTAHSAEMARKAGDTQLAEQFEGDLKRTFLGMNPRSPREASLYTRQAVSPAERDYIEQFKNLRTTSERNRALNLVPEESQYLLANLWQQDLPRGVHFEDPNLSSAARRYSPYEYPKEALGGFLETHSVPEKEWAGWDPRVAMDASKIKWIDNHGDNIHNYGLWESEKRRYGRQFPNITAPDLTPQESSPARVHNNLTRLGLEVIEERGGLMFDYAGQARLEVEMRRPRSRSKGYDGQRKQFENSKVYFPEPS